MSGETKVTLSSGNVFADLRLPNADEEVAKVDLAFEISRVIDERGLTQIEAAEIMGVDQPKVSALVRYRLVVSRWSGYIGSSTRLAGTLRLSFRQSPSTASRRR